MKLYTEHHWKYRLGRDERHAIMVAAWRHGQSRWVYRNGSRAIATREQLEQFCAEEDWVDIDGWREAEEARG